MSESIPLFILATSLGLLLYTYAGYPALLYLIGRVVHRPLPEGRPENWPLVSISVPAYNLAL